MLQFNAASGKGIFLSSYWQALRFCAVSRPHLQLGHLEHTAKPLSHKDQQFVFPVLLLHSVSNLSFPSPEKEVLEQNEQKLTHQSKISCMGCDYQKSVSHLLAHAWNSRDIQRWEAALMTDLIFVVSRGTVLASLFPGPLKYRDFPSLSTPQPVPTWPPVILYQRGLSFLSNLSNISLWLGTFDTQVPCDA